MKIHYIRTVYLTFVCFNWAFFMSPPGHTHFLSSFPPNNVNLGFPYLLIDSGAEYELRGLLLRHFLLRFLAVAGHFDI